MKWNPDQLSMIFNPRDLSGLESCDGCGRNGHGRGLRRTEWILKDTGMKAVLCAKCALVCRMESVLEDIGRAKVDAACEEKEPKP